MHERGWSGEIHPTETSEPISPETGLSYGCAEKPLMGQDFVITDHRRGVYAVFDGMGGVGDQNAGKDASMHAANMCHSAYRDADIGSNIKNEKLRMVEWMDQAHRTMYTEVGKAGTTATAVRMVKEGGSHHIVWASVGDSRLYLYRDGELQLLTEDESTDGNALYNCLGVGRGEINQVGDIRLKPKDRLMLCSDGITGDYEQGLLKDREIIAALSKPTPRDSAVQLIQNSRKQDDKSVIVIDFLGQQANIPNQPSSEFKPKPLYERRLGSREVFRIHPDKPIEDRGGYSVVALIQAAATEFALLDLRNTAQDESGRRRAFGESGGGWYADLLLVDESFADYLRDPHQNPTGYKAIRPGDKIPVGRNHNLDRFDLPDTVSRNHFRIDYNEENGSIIVINQAPTNGTIVKVSKDIFTP